VKAESDAQRSLIELLYAVLPDNATCAAVLLEALDDAGLEEFPDGAHELRAFAGTYLLAPLADQLGEERARELVLEVCGAYGVGDGASGAASPPRPGVGTASSAVTMPPGAQPLSPTLGRVPDRHLLSSGPGRRAASLRIRAIVAAAARARITEERASALLLHTDRLARASVARALANARFDVRVVEKADHLPAGLESFLGGVVVIVVDVAEDGVLAALRALPRPHSRLRVLAWTRLDEAVAASQLTGMNAMSFAVVPRASTEVELVDAARRLAAQDPAR
jgi:hypothetical protein